MKIAETVLPGVLRITPPTVHQDHRGIYVETWNEALYARLLPDDVRFVQDDVSVSRYGVLRGIHGDQETWKFITCLYGEIYLVVVNNDPQSPAYRDWLGIILAIVVVNNDPESVAYRAEEGIIVPPSIYQQILVPPKHGIGHLVLSHHAVFGYQQSSYYGTKQFTIPWNDPELAIPWPMPKGMTPITSERDRGY